MADATEYSYLIFTEDGVLLQEGKSETPESEFMASIDKHGPCCCFYSFERFSVGIDWNSTTQIAAVMYNEKLGNVYFAKAVKETSEIDLCSMFEQVLDKHPELRAASVKSARKL